MIILLFSYSQSPGSFSRCCFMLLSAGDSSKLLTGSADSSAKLWDLSTGKELFTFKFNEPCRGVAFSLGDGMAAISSDPFMGVPSAIHLVTIAGVHEPHSGMDPLRMFRGVAAEDLELGSGNTMICGQCPVFSDVKLG